MSDALSQLRDACAEVVRRARYVRVNPEAIPAYAASLPLGEGRPEEAEGASAEAAAAPAETAAPVPAEHPAAFWLTLDAINFGSGWFPTLSKPKGKSGYHT